MLPLVGNGKVLVGNSIASMAEVPPLRHDASQPSLQAWAYIAGRSRRRDARPAGWASGGLERCFLYRGLWSSSSHRGLSWIGQFRPSVSQQRARAHELSTAGRARTTGGPRARAGAAFQKGLSAGPMTPEASRRCCKFARHLIVSTRSLSSSRLKV